MPVEPITHLEKSIAGTVEPITHLEKSIAGTVEPVTHLEKVIDQYGGGEAVLIQKTITANGTFAAADDNADGYSSVTVEVPGGGGRYTLLASGSYTWASSSSVLTIPVSYAGTAKRFGAIATEPIADTAQMVCFCELTDAQLFPSEFAAPDHKGGYGFAWGYRADNSINHEAYTGGISGGLSASQIFVNRLNSAYPWRPNTYNWYIWGVSE